MQPEASALLCLMCGRRTPVSVVQAEQQRQMEAEAAQKQASG
jgi:hypothetical protein